MNFLADKAVDCVFIFLGVYVAFAFTDWQEDLRKKKELNFLVEQIMVELPTLPPKKQFKRFEINFEQKDSKTCSYSRSLPFGTDYRGKQYFDVITARGLGGYFKDNRILRMIGSFYISQVPNLSDDLDVFFDSVDKDMQAIAQLAHETQSGNLCKFKKEFMALEKKYGSLWTTLQTKKVIISLSAFKLQEELKKQGYKAAPTSAISLKVFAAPSKESEDIYDVDYEWKEGTVTPGRRIEDLQEDLLEEAEEDLKKIKEAQDKKDPNKPT